MYIYIYYKRVTRGWERILEPVHPTDHKPTRTGTTVQSLLAFHGGSLDGKGEKKTQPSGVRFGLEPRRIRDQRPEIQMQDQGGAHGPRHPGDQETAGC